MESAGRPLASFALFTLSVDFLAAVRGDLGDLEDMVGDLRSLLIMWNQARVVRTWLEVRAGLPLCSDGIMSFALIVGLVAAARGERGRSEVGGAGLGLRSGW